MDLHPLHPSPLPREDEAPHECFNLLAAECTAIKGNLDCRNFQLQRLQVHAIKKVEDVEENLEHFTICCLKIASRMKDGTFLVHGFLMEPKLMRKILRMELQIQRGLKWPLRDVLSEMKFTLLRPSKIPASLLLDAQPKMWPLLQLSQFTGAIPSLDPLTSLFAPAHDLPPRPPRHPGAPPLGLPPGPLRRLDSPPSGLQPRPPAGLQPRPPASPDAPQYDLPPRPLALPCASPPGRPRAPPPGLLPKPPARRPCHSPRSPVHTVCMSKPPPKPYTGGKPPPYYPPKSTTPNRGATSSSGTKGGSQEASSSETKRSKTNEPENRQIPAVRNWELKPYPVSALPADPPKKRCLSVPNGCTCCIL